jgi:hypothetical protein
MDNERATDHRRPRWVVLLGVALVLVVVVIVLAMLLGGGQHGPDMHTLGG